MTHRISYSAAALLVLAFASSAGAQTTSTATFPTYEVSLGYQLLRAGEVCAEEEIIDGQVVETCQPDRVFPFGFAVDVARNYESLGIVGEVGWSRDSEDDVSFGALHFAGGGRYTFRNTPRVVPYAQLLLGVVRSSFDADELNIDGSTTSFMLQPGGGVFFSGGGSWGLFGQVDLRHVFLDEDENLGGSRDDFRVLVGVRLGI